MSTEQKAVIRVEGMSCEHCKAAVEKVARSVSGVTDAKVDLNNKNITIFYNGDSEVVRKIRAGIENSGYDVPE